MKVLLLTCCSLRVFAHGLLGNKRTCGRQRGKLYHTIRKCHSLIAHTHCNQSFNQATKSRAHTKASTPQTVQSSALVPLQQGLVGHLGPQAACLSAGWDWAGIVIHHIRVLHLEWGSRARPTCRGERSRGQAPAEKAVKTTQLQVQVGDIMGC